MPCYDNSAKSVSSLQDHFEEDDLNYLDLSSPLPQTTPQCWQQLIIIGNGFDLECGLKTRYSDFFNPRREEIYPKNPGHLTSSYQDYIVKNKITVWDVILEECANYLWNDIEKAIESWVVPSPQKGESHFQRLLSLLNPNIESSIDKKEREHFSWRRYVGRIDDVIPEAPIARFILQTTRSKKRSWSEAQLYNYLLNQLSLLENEFKAYLNTQLTKATDYPQVAWRLLYDLLTPFYPPSKNIEKITSVLNFNYTNPAAEKRVGIPLQAINIHGKLNGEIIFGIDGKDHLGNHFVAPFTKTYRLLGLHSTNRFSLFENVENTTSVDTPIKVIKFYGHSLSDSDYSYFQAIFDEVNLYAGNTRLIFYYRNHPGVEDARSEMSKAVSHLLAEYGRTMDNTDHGKNLMHKLILEGRLSVLELKKTQN